MGVDAGSGCNGTCGGALACAHPVTETSNIKSVIVLMGFIKIKMSPRYLYLILFEETNSLHKQATCIGSSKWRAA